MKLIPPCPVIDVHHHFATMDAAVWTGGAGHGSDPRAEFMAEHHIDGVFVLAGATGVNAANAPSVNDGVAAYRAKDPDKYLAAFATVDPTDVAAAVREVDRAAVELGVDGFVFHHHFQQTTINDQRMRPILEAIQRHRKPVFVHIVSGSLLEDPWRLAELAQEFPEITFVGLDGFSSPGGAGEMVLIAKQCPNLLFDTALLASVAHGLDAFVEAVGPERLLLGTDFYTQPRLYQVPFPLYEVLNLGLTDDELAAILSGNARRLIGRA
ncbi:hypothetical protein SAMN05443637_11158 [Pseudonocardia thermophila]|uniref:Amidohydrolase-related domain-containing protein n=1 Tax=Pseudonocardia thermophila TaxID=1848 RepID=A0A1M6UWT0_PSETH|nr:amidohydrolase family protein [Pseudonocardia thermophila]SHK73640.1 hypothetical protein SAMN05443637_11158 [Pseudonocardia thermophila]